MSGLSSETSTRATRGSAPDKRQMANASSAESPTAAGHETPGAASETTASRSNERNTPASLSNDSSTVRWNACGAVGNSLESQTIDERGCASTKAACSAEHCEPCAANSTNDDSPARNSSDSSMSLNGEPE
eukprot:Amastigsp_a842516_32.p4 type:complete len:131 gc:universal Amastigsp_a842516_32:929-537(-)